MKAFTMFTGGANEVNIAETADTLSKSIINMMPGGNQEEEPDQVTQYMTMFVTMLSTLPMYVQLIPPESLAAWSDFLAKFEAGCVDGTMPKAEVVKLATDAYVGLLASSCTPEMILAGLAASLGSMSSLPLPEDALADWAQGAANS